MSEKKYNMFAGCSFTWGQGLWSYYKTDEYIPTVTQYITNELRIPEDAYEFRKKVRWPQLVSNEIGGTPLIKKLNGGTDYESYEQINKWLVEYNPNEIEYLVFQTTQLYRSPFPFKLGDKLYHLRSTPNFKNLTRVDLVKYQNEFHIEYENDNVGIDYFYEWLIENNLDIFDFENIHREYVIKCIENVFIKCENLGIKTYLLSWTDEYLKSIYNNPFLLDRFITFEYNGNVYDCIEKMQMENNHLYIKFDNKNKIHDDGGDLHPSLECHEVIANSVLKKIKNG